MTLRTALRELAHGLRKLFRGSKRRREVATHNGGTMNQGGDETQKILHIRLSSAPAVLSWSPEASISSYPAMETGNRQRPSDVRSAIATRNLRTMEVKGKRLSNPQPTMATQHPQTSDSEDKDSVTATRPRQSSDMKGKRKPRSAATLTTSYKRPEGYQEPRNMGQASPSPSAYLFHGLPGEPVPVSNRDKLLVNRPRQKTPQLCVRSGGCGYGCG
ncbi:hypothetical protein PG985_015241 [Apiospora marii]|uniref:Uncharacterized protein n=1 Tax=Apiospora marii TaxID=335849 RepID=A0ABR1S600_9PEZI